MDAGLLTLSIENTFYLQTTHSIIPRGRQWPRATRACSGPLTGVADTYTDRCICAPPETEVQGGRVKRAPHVIKAWDVRQRSRCTCAPPDT